MKLLPRITRYRIRTSRYAVDRPRAAERQSGSAAAGPAGTWADVRLPDRQRGACAQRGHVRVERRLTLPGAAPTRAGGIDRGLLAAARRRRRPALLSAHSRRCPRGTSQARGVAALYGGRRRSVTLCLSATISRLRNIYVGSRRY